MRKLLFAALVAVCATFPGEVSATPSLYSIEASTESNISDQVLVSRISEASGYSIYEVESLFEVGEIQISEGDGYFIVTISSSDGAGIVIMIEDL